MKKDKLDDDDLLMIQKCELYSLMHKKNEILQQFYTERTEKNQQISTAFQYAKKLLDIENHFECNFKASSVIKKELEELKYLNESLDSRIVQMATEYSIILKKWNILQKRVQAPYLQDMNLRNPMEIPTYTELSKKLERDCNYFEEQKLVFLQKLMQFYHEKSMEIE